MTNRYIAVLFLLFLAIVYSCNKSDEPENIESENERSYKKSIERIANSDFAASLIEKAENYYPPREEVAQIASPWIEVPDSGYWYYNDFDGVYIPFAITSDAVIYYSGLIDTFNANKKDVFFITANFNYQAKVTFYENYSSPDINSHGDTVIPEDFNSVYVVELALKWNQYCGNLCAMWIDKKRIAVFNPSGELLKVFLDGEIRVPVS